MPAVRRIAAVCAALLMLAGCGSASDGDESSSRTTRPGGPHPGSTWRYDHTGSDTNAAFVDIAAASADDAWAVGRTPVTGQIDDQRTLLLRYDGTTWRPYDLPPPLRRLDALDSVRLDASGPDDVWLFGGGRTGPDRSPEALAAHWDGTAWRAVDLPQGFTSGVSGAAVLGPRDAWVVDGSDSAWHWDGRQWRGVRLPARANDLAGVSGRDLWAVGSRPARRVGPARTQLPGPAAMHWDGSAWKQASMPALPPGPKDDPREGGLTRVIARSADDVRAYGSMSSEGGDSDAFSSGLALRWDGSRWRQESGEPCCVRGRAADALFLSPARYLTPSGEERRITQPPCLAGERGRLGKGGCGQKLEIEEYAAVPGTRQVWGVGSVRGGKDPSRPVILRLTTAR